MLFRNFACWTAGIWLLTVFCPLVNAVQVGEVTKADDALKNIAIYVSKRQVVSFGVLKELAKAESAEIELVEGEADNWKQVKVSWPTESLTIARKAGDDLQQHLNGFQGYVFSQLAETKMDAHVYGILQQIQRTKNSYGCVGDCLLYTSPSPRDQRGSRMPSSA